MMMNGEFTRGRCTFRLRSETSPECPYVAFNLVHRILNKDTWETLGDVSKRSLDIDRIDLRKQLP